MNHNTSMNQQEVLTDLLSQEKQLIKDYAGDITESSCTNLRQLLIKNMTECSTDQYAVFDQMRQRNMYQTKKAQQSDVQATQQSVQQLKQQTGF